MAEFAWYKADTVPSLKSLLKTMDYEILERALAPFWCSRYRGCPVLGSKRANRAVPRIMRLAFCQSLRYQTPMTNESIENLAEKLAAAVPEGLRSMREDLEHNFRAVLRSSLSKLDLVTREEFEVQEAVLARTREKLEALEAKLEQHEQ